MARPGVVPLRPLTLGDLLGGAVQTIQRNPRATIGLALVVSALFMLLPVLASVAVGLAGSSPGFDVGASEDPFAGAGGASYYGLLGVSTVFSALATVVIAGLIVRVVGAAVVGRPMRAGEAWRRTRGRLVALVGLSLLGGLVSVVLLAAPVALGVLAWAATDSVALGVVLGILLGLAAVVATVWLWTRFLLLAAPALVLEELGVVASLRRAGALSRGQFWRLLGIALLAGLIAGVASQVVAVPFSVLGAVLAFVLPPAWGLPGLLLASNVGSILTGALVGPFTAGVTGLQYVDQRFRKEGLDITLLDETLRR
ncbi:hypothetical protein [Nocardioides aurantiacus]|uniref:hypothetical protein n=1 Tax=Nocardioides aurantiacus TaxID=86796 RepID=UPI0011CDBA74|nr:hypothetical protein [Nocardioides aurantiacus]